VVFGVEGEVLAAGEGAVAVGVVRLRRDLVVGVVIKAAGVDRAQCGICREPVANRVQAVADAAIVLFGVAGDLFVGQPVDAVVAPVERAAVLLRGLGAASRGPELIGVTGGPRIQRGETV
jgi:hypothetical protein